MSVIPVAVYTVAAISLPDLRELGQKRASVALVDYCVSASLAKSTRAAVIAFGGTSSGVAIVYSGSSGSIFKFWRNAFTNVGCGCAATCSGFSGTNFAQFDVQYESLFEGHLLAKLDLRYILFLQFLKWPPNCKHCLGNGQKNHFKQLMSITQQM
ncbi:MAG: hypothetical protein EZS28_025868 [Streblomastix strix]|uniref:Uncharacterized protein n=1 Tax=Streblomastix strix TaxID=222440 RepID=A0A5J4V7I9_9EUKA|nr:MAG: hypothetical protein EZS28_025868 [Streblomastix strix]